MSVLTEDILNYCDPFSCGEDDDMDDFFRSNAIVYSNNRIGKTYCFRSIDNPKTIVACFTVSNDSIRIFDLGSSKKNRLWKEISNREKKLSRYPGVLIGRLAVSASESGKGLGSEILHFIKEWFAEETNKSGCRLAIVDAKNKPSILGFYEKNGFKCLFNTEIDEYRYMRNSSEPFIPGHLETRLMYCDLLK